MASREEVQASTCVVPIAYAYDGESFVLQSANA